MSEFPLGLLTEGSVDFTGEENFFYDLATDTEWVLSWDVISITPDG